MTQSTMTEDDIFNSNNLSPREQVTDWEKGALKKLGVGSKIAGRFVGFWLVPAKLSDDGKKELFGAQLGVALRDLKNPEVIYGLNLSTYMQDKLQGYNVDDIVGFEYFKDIPSKQKGLSATKAIRAYNVTEIERMKNGIKATGTTMTVEEDVHTDSIEEDEDPLKMNELGKPEQDLAADGLPV